MYDHWLHQPPVSDMLALYSIFILYSWHVEADSSASVLFTQIARDVEELYFLMYLSLFLQLQTAHIYHL